MRVAESRRGKKAIPPAHIPSLDGWRGIAILLVLASHTAIAFRHIVYVPHVDAIGQHGVAIFFVLSGFLITRLLVSEDQANSSINLRSFYVRRFFRLAPCAWVYLAVLIALYSGVQHKPFTAGDIVGSLFFFRNFIDATGLHASATGHFWSLSIEEQFYLVWPSILVFAGVKRCRWICVIGALIIAFYRLQHWEQLAQLPLQATFGTQYRADSLLIGCAAALWLRDLEPYLRKWMTLPLVFALVACMATYGQLIPIRESVVIALLLAITSMESRSNVTSLLDWMPLRTIGKYSYSLYIWQQLLLLTRWPPHILLAFCSLYSQR
jgi:peptidoglycan/LPS O-acetylase OafA/YrhL